jgi:uncharacterized protein (TIGR03084 family)
VREILSDLVAEQQSLDQFLQSIDVRKWGTPTPAAGWDIRDSVSHLAHSEEYAANALTEGGTRLPEAASYPTPEDFTQAGVERGHGMRPQDVLEWWRGARAKVVEALSKAAPDARVPWFAGTMSARSFASARLMETWAHGLDIHAAVGSEAEDTPRLRHVALLSQLAFPYAFQVAGEPYPRPVRLELSAPGYRKWVFGPADTDQVIRGAAGEWCRVAVRRAKASETDLVAEGEVAEVALRVARAYV